MGWKGYALVFVAVALAGLAVWVISTPPMAGSIFGDAGYRAAYSFPLWAYFGLPLLVLPSLVAGFALPKGFPLWGVAAVVAYVPGFIWLSLRTPPEVAFQTADPGVRQILGLVFVEVLTVFVLMLACTVASGIGAAARLLLWRLRGEPAAHRLGMSSGNDASV